MKINVVFSNMMLDGVSSILRNDLENKIKSAANRFFKVNNIEIQLLEGSCDNSNIDVFICVCTDLNFKEKSILFNRFSSKLKKYIIEFKKQVSPLCDIKKDNIFISVDDKLDIHTSNEADYDEFDINARARWYTAEVCAYNFNMVILPQKTQNEILEAAQLIRYSDTIYNKWGLRETTPKSVALNFYGESGTGKTMAAQAFASLLGKKIIKASYADIESKYHGEGPKMVKALFLAALQQDAVIFIDEADSLLSKRLLDVTQGSEQAINSIRSQLLISLEQYDVTVIFATNLIENYDKAFITRLNCIRFEFPDVQMREKIWNVHLFPTDGNSLNIPLSNDININRLSQDYVFCGRDIREAVKYACVNALMNDCQIVSMENLIYGCESVMVKKKEITKEISDS